MNKPTVSRSNDALLLTATQAQCLYQFSRGLIDRAARDCKARVKVGKSVRYDRAKLDAYFGITP